MKLEIESISIAPERGMIKEGVKEAVVNELGIEGDSHAGNWPRQITLLARESITKFNQEHGTDFDNGQFACNIVVGGLDFSKVALFDRFRFHDVLLEVTKIGKKPHAYNSPVYEKTSTNIMFTEGIFCRVVSTGEIKEGYLGTHIEMPFKIKVITLSDRASKGEYEDLSGPAVTEKLNEFFSELSYHPEIENIIIPDDEELLANRLEEAVEENYLSVFTTGGTGLGPRDITPDVVMDFCDRLLPGVMEMIRVKYGADKPNALLSRSVAGLSKQTLIYALPGSVKAVNEYMSEILRSFEHAVLMARGGDH